MLEHQISVLEWFLKDHVKIKTGVMTPKNSALPSQNKLHKKNNIYIKYILLYFIIK